MNFLIYLAALAVVGLLLAEYYDWEPGVWIFKPAASLCFIFLALVSGATGSSYGWLILLGLILSFFGDVFLIPKDRENIFQAGVVSFLLAHVAYAIAFFWRGVDPLWCAVATSVCALIMYFVLPWLRPSIPADMKTSVYAYMGVISTMVVLAVGTYGLLGNTAIPVGAIGFYLSDLSVAKDRFVSESFFNRLWGLPLYFGSQLILAGSVVVG